MSLKASIIEDMKSAMKAGNKERLKVLRLMLSDIKRIEIDSRKELDDPATLAVLEKAVKQRRDSIDQFVKGQREDLADIERAELGVIESYLPEQLSEEELDALVAETIRSTGAETIRDMGKVMAAIKAQAAGKADMAAVGARVKAQLA